MQGDAERNFAYTLQNWRITFYLSANNAFCFFILCCSCAISKLCDTKYLHCAMYNIIFPAKDNFQNKLLRFPATIHQIKQFPKDGNKFQKNRSIIIPYKTSKISDDNSPKCTQTDHYNWFNTPVIFNLHLVIYERRKAHMRNHFSDVHYRRFRWTFVFELSDVNQHAIY